VVNNSKYLTVFIPSTSGKPLGEVVSSISKRHAIQWEFPFIGGELPVDRFSKILIEGEARMLYTRKTTG
jgi:hypothetical protein